MTRYFYRCPIAAAWQEKNFGIDFDLFYFTEKTEHNIREDKRYFRAVFTQIIEWYKNPAEEAINLAANYINKNISIDEYEQGLAEIEYRSEPQSAKIYVSPDSLPLLQPMVGDLVET